METVMGRGRPKETLVSSEAEREQLHVWSRRRKPASADAILAGIERFCLRIPNA
jgi:hypothetical protein